VVCTMYETYHHSPPKERLPTHLSQEAAWMVETFLEWS
jgi:hypothetical protein